MAVKKRSEPMSMREADEAGLRQRADRRERLQEGEGRFELLRTLMRAELNDEESSPDEDEDLDEAA